MRTRDIENIFADIVDCAKALDPVNVRAWFDKLTVLHFNGGLLVVGCPDGATAEFLRSNCKGTFTRAAQEVTKHLVTVDFSVHAAQPLVDAHGSYSCLKLHPDYTFENFVVGPSNRLAHASCVAVSQSPGDTYNPLFLYGSSGLGKTHLLHAVCHDMSIRSAAAIGFLSCEDFVNRFITAIGDGDLASFQSQFRTVDALIIDDVQFLREREQSQEEFFHTFNALYNSGKQIILSADSPPAKIPSLEDRLISRFSWGLVARIDPPSHDTRVAIVQKKAHLRGLDISTDIAEYVARKVQANVRELEGALTAIYAVANTTGRQIDLEIAQQALEGQAWVEPKRVSMTDIINVVTRHFDVPLADLQSKNRGQSITVPRQVCMYLARNLTGHSLEEIGDHLGGRDHTTVMHACSKISQMENSDPQMSLLLRELAEQVSRRAQTR